MECPENEVSCLGSLYGNLYCLQVTHLTDKDNIRIFTQCRAQGGGKALGMVVDFPLVDETLLVRMNKLYRVFNRDYVFRPGSVYEIDHCCQRRTLPTAGRTCHQQHAVGRAGSLLKISQATRLESQAFEVGRDAALVQDPHDRLLSADNRQRGEAKVDRASLVADLKLAVLGLEADRDVQIGEDFDPGQEGRQHRLWRIHRLDQTAIDAAAAEVAAGATAAGCKEGVCAGLAANITDEASVVTLIDGAKAFLGERIDILVNVAGIVGQGKVEEITVEDWDRMFAVNCRGSFLLIKHVVPLMKKGGGKIVNYSSKSGKTGSALMTHYSGAKAAVIGMTQALAYELASDNITVNCVCPGITESTGVWNNVSAGYIKELKMPEDEVIKKFTAKVPLARLAKINDVVAVTVFLASPGADYMTGQAINITGGREMH